MQSDESRCALLQSNGRVRVRKEVHGVMNPSCTMASVQTSGGRVVIWGLGSAMLCGSKMKSADYLCGLSDQVFSLDFFSCLMAGGIFQCQWQDSSSSNLERVLQEVLVIIFTHELATTES